ncbi:cyclin-dependent kinase inhibitor 1 isoform X2 [Megalops cyprinoides]|nr:cyclin-dependent kinase inhibitor 1 isoform X2 [Megalops cyprinoides]
MSISLNKRILTALSNGPTRRNLFGPVDREQLQLEYQDSLRKDLEDASRRWGFDFLTETPLKGGDYQWEGISGTKVPVLYRSCMVGAVEVVRPGGVSGSGVGSAAAHSGKENIPRTPNRDSLKPQNLETTPEKSQSNNQSNKLKRKQTNITDFYQAKRRVVATPRKSGQ